MILNYAQEHIPELVLFGPGQMPGTDIAIGGEMTEGSDDLDGAVREDFLGEFHDQPFRRTS